MILDQKQIDRKERKTPAAIGQVQKNRVFNSNNDSGPKHVFIAKAKTIAAIRQASKNEVLKRKHDLRDKIIVITKIIVVQQTKKRLRQ